MILYIKLNASAQQRKQHNEKGAYGLEENTLISDKELIFQSIQRAPKTHQGFSGGSGVKNLPASAET